MRADAKKALLNMISDGWTIKAAVEELGYSQISYENWRRDDRQWAEEVSRARRMAQSSGRQKREQSAALPFAEFSEKYLRAKVFPHTQNIVDLIERREPSWLHPAMTFVKGKPDLIIVNVPPEHAKTMGVTINYATYLTCMNPNIRGLVVSKAKPMAEKMLYAVKQRLTSPLYADLQRDFGGENGFKGDGDSSGGKWTQDTIYLSDELRTSGEKDPTWQALGIGGQVYGARADVIIMDDVIDRRNAHQFSDQIDWIQTEVMTRVDLAGGTLIMVGTRLAPQDLYMEIQNPTLYPDEESPFTYLAMPAVLEFSENRDEWVTLWPRTNMPDVGDRDPKPDKDGLYEKWSGRRLFDKRARMRPDLWSRVYQQQQVGEDTVFNPEDVKGCINGARHVGLIPSGRPGLRPEGMGGLIVVAGLDPATSGYTAMCVMGLDVQRQRRYVLDVFNQANCRPDDIRNAIYRLTEKYGIVEWVVETNGFQGFLAHDREVNQFLASRGALLRPHHTGTIKHDPDFGVSAMAGLFKGWPEGHNLVELPSTYQSEGAKALVEQLCVWVPKAKNKHLKTDAVMAFWMAELACLRRIEMASNYSRSHRRSNFLTRFDRRRQVSVNIGDIETFDRVVSVL